ncbi:MAG: family 43 glycosylhydrolase [Fibrobacterota bacterium]|nr:family 43 glycosylhydrolase [Fibrobacterota bacterium]QQS06885.1 MAG: family 43 glycosylhydrolase [Fibrobacterota bacterium]
MCRKLSLGLLAFASIGFSENPIIQTKFTADPAPLVWNDTVFLYTTRDNDNATANGGFQMTDWMLYTSTDMVNWRDRGIIATLKNFTWGPQTNGAWAPQMIQRNGKFYFYAPLHGKGIGVLVADNPYGPFKDPLGKALVSADPWKYIDPSPFIDSDGQAYLYFGNPDAWWVKLNPDMISTSGPITLVPRLKTYQEGPWIYKRNSLYYLAFASTCCPEGIGYATGPSPTGPWTYKGSIMDGNSKSSGNHPGIIDFKGKSYVFGFNYERHFSMVTDHRERRSVCLAELKYNADGTIPKLPWWGAGMPSGPGVAAVDSLNPYLQTEAETMAWSKGVLTETSSEGGMALSGIENGDFIKLKSVDFGLGASSFEARVASATSGGTIEIRLDGETGKLVGTCAIAGTGGLQTWTTKSCAVSGATGVHDLFLVFKGGSGTLFNFNWWKFNATSSVVGSPVQASDVGFRVDVADHQLTITSSSPMTGIELVSAQGEVRSLESGNIVRVSTEGFRSGLYFIKAQVGGSVRTRRILLNL